MRLGAALVSTIAIAALALLWQAPAAGALGGGDNTGWTISAEPSHPAVGDTVLLTATAYGQGGYPRFTLHLDEQNPPMLRVDSPLSVDRIMLAATAEWDMTVLRPGRQTVRVSVSYEKTVCTGPPGPPPDCVFYFVSSSSPMLTIDVPAAAGDPDCDGKSTSIDAALVMQREAGLTKSLPCDAAADVNGDGRIDSVDAALILQFVAGLISGYPYPH